MPDFFVILEITPVTAGSWISSIIISEFLVKSVV